MHPKNFMFLVDGKSIQPANSQNFGNVDDPEITMVERGWIVPYGYRKLATFLSERMDFENRSLFHSVYFNDYSSFCLK
jgi:hypothetical protein